MREDPLGARPEPQQGWWALCVLMVAAETSSGATWLPHPSQTRPGSSQSAAWPSESLCDCLWPGSVDRAFPSPGTHILRLLGGARTWKGGATDDIPVWTGLRCALTSPASARAGSPACPTSPLSDVWLPEDGEKQGQGQSEKPDVRTSLHGLCRPPAGRLAHGREEAVRGRRQPELRRKCPAGKV